MEHNPATQSLLLMRTISTLLAVLVTTVSVQAQRSFFHIYPDPIDPAIAQSSSFTDRGILNNGDGGEVLAELPAGMLSHVGGVDLSTCLFSAVEFVEQDEFPLTQHQYNLIFRSRNSNGDGPDTRDEGLIAFAGPLTTPFSNMVTPQAWCTTITFLTPGAMPCSSDFFFGLELAAAPIFPADGQSLHMAHYTLGSVGDWPRQDAPGLAWSFANGISTPTQDSAVWDIALLTEAPTLQLGNDDPNNPGGVNGTLAFGAGGFFPDVSGLTRNDGLVARVSDDSNHGGFAFVFMNSSLNPMPGLLPGIGGVLAINPAGRLRLLRSGSISDNPSAAHNFAEIVLSPPGNPVLPSLLGAFVTFQAITVDATQNLANFFLTNAVRVSL